MNPVETEHRGIFKLLESFVVHTAPIRVGIVLAVNSSTKLTGLDDAGVALLCSFNYVVQQKNPQAALSFLTSVRAALVAIHFSRVKRKLIFRC